MTETLERKLQRRMSKALNRAVKFQGVGYRNVGQQFANRQDIVSTIGSLNWGGRYNVARNFGVLYLSCDLDTCLKELEHAARYEGVSIEEKLPRTVTGIKVQLLKVLDLTDTRVRKEIGIPKKILVETDWAKENRDGREAPTQMIGRLARDAGFDALLVPSARWSGKNLNLLDDGKLSSRVLVINLEALGPKKRAGIRRRP